jgi:LmbE family N-acetylglucosaminyl deacetylase
MLTVDTTTHSYILSLLGLSAGDCIMLVGAHPDDMDYATGGLQAMASAAGLRVINVVATCGEAGVLDESRWPRSTLRQTRCAEQDIAAALLGAIKPIYLGYGDGRLGTYEAAPAIKRLRDLMDFYSPKLVVTYGPDGLTGHSDHQVISDWVTRAFRLYGTDKGDLWYIAATPEWQADIQPHLEKAKAIYRAPEVYGPGDLALDLELPETILRLKLLAVKSHASQSQPLDAAIGGLELLLPWFRRETYRLGA